MGGDVLTSGGRMSDRVEVQAAEVFRGTPTFSTFGFLNGILVFP